MTTAKLPALAIDGGTPVRTTPWPPRRLFGPEEKAAALAVFDESIASGNAFGYAGPHEQAYEKAFADWLGGGFAKGVNSGTSAVLSALAALNLQPGSEVVCSCITDPGMVMPVAFLNCLPIPADTEPWSFNISAAQIEKAITPRTRAIVVAHIMGEPLDMDAIMAVAGKHNLPVVEDCSQAHGATLRDRLVGTFGTISVFSTMSGKHHASAAQGGMVFTRDENLFWRARRFMDRGKSYGLDLPEMTNVQLGLNLNSSELAAAVGLVQFKRLPNVLLRRRALAATLEQKIKHLKAIRLGRMIDGAKGVYWFLRLTVDAGMLRVDKNQFAEAVSKEGIPVWVTYAGPFCDRPWFTRHEGVGCTGWPWKSPAYHGNPDQKFALPNAEHALASNFLLYFHENLTPQDMNQAAKTLEKVEQAYLK